MRTEKERFLRSNLRRARLLPGLLAFTRHSFTPKLYCTSPPSWYGLAHMHCSHDGNTLARLFCAIYDSSPAFLSYAILHTIVVMAISCKGQPGLHVSLSQPIPHGDLFTPQPFRAVVYSQRLITVACSQALRLGLYTILPSPKWYGVWHIKEGSVRGGVYHAMVVQ